MKHNLIKNLPKTGKQSPVGKTYLNISLILFCFLLSTSLHAKALFFQLDSKAKNEATLAKGGELVLPDSSLKIIFEKTPFLNKNPSLDEVEIFIENFNLKRNILTQSDADLLLAVYSKYKNKLNEKINVKTLLTLADIYNGLYKSGQVFQTIREIEKYNLSNYYRSLVWYNYGLAHQELGNYDIALENYIRAIPYLEKENENKNLSSIYSDMGRLYNTLNKYDKSIIYYLKAVNTAKLLGDDYLLAKYYSNIGTTYKKMESYDLAIEYYSKGLEMAKKLNDPFIISQNLLNLGNVLLRQEKHLLAHEKYLESLTICKANNIIYGILLNYINMGENAMKWGKLNLSLSMQDSALTLFDKMNLPYEKLDLLKNRASLFEEMKKFQNAYLVLKEAYELESELFNKEKQTRIDELTLKYETAITEKDLEKTSIQLKSSKLKTLVFIVLTVILFLILGITIKFYRFRILKIKELYWKNIETLKFHEEKKGSLNVVPEKKTFENKSDDNLETLFDQINYFLIKESGLNDPELNLATLSLQVKSNTKYVSQAIQKHTDKNFNTYINHLRIMEAKKIIYDSFLDANLNLNDVMTNCGFKSRSTFYNAFQKETGMSPKQFKDLALSNQPGLTGQEEDEF